MVGAMPFLAIVGAILSKVTAVMSSKSQEAYTRASSIAQQALAQVMGWDGPLFDVLSCFVMFCSVMFCWCCLMCCRVL